MVVTAAEEDAHGDPVDAQDLADWVDYFDLSFPVVADPGGAADMLYDPERETRPTYALIAPGLEVVSVGSTVEAAEIEAVLPG